MKLGIAVCLPNGGLWQVLFRMAPTECFVLDYGNRDKLISHLKERLDIAGRIVSIQSIQNSQSSRPKPGHFNIIAKVGMDHLKVELPCDLDYIFGLQADTVRGALAPSAQQVNQTQLVDPASDLSLCSCCRKGLQKINTCSLCRRAMYCDTECQRKHWKASHKGECSRSAAPATVSEMITSS